MKGCFKKSRGHISRTVAGITRRVVHGAAVIIAARAGLHPSQENYIHSMVLTCLHKVRVSLGQGTASRPCQSSRSLPREGILQWQRNIRGKLSFGSVFLLFC